MLQLVCQMLDITFSKMRAFLDCQIPWMIHRPTTKTREDVHAVPICWGVSHSYCFLCCWDVLFWISIALEPVSIRPMGLDIYCFRDCLTPTNNATQGTFLNLNMVRLSFRAVLIVLENILGKTFQLLSKRLWHCSTYIHRKLMHILGQFLFSKIDRGFPRPWRRIGTKTQ